MRYVHIGTAQLSDVIDLVVTYVTGNMQRSIPMIIPSQITIENEVIDIAAVEARARKLRAEAMAEFGRHFRSWLKTLNVGFAARTAQ